MIKTLITFVIAGIGFIITVDYANAGHRPRIDCWRDSDGEVYCELIERKPRPAVPVNVPTPTYPQ